MAQKQSLGPGGGKKRHSAEKQPPQKMSLKSQLKTMSKLTLNMELLFIIFCIFFAVLSLRENSVLEMGVIAFLTVVEGIAITIAFIPQKRYYLAIFNTAALIIVFWRFTVVTSALGL